MGPSVAALQAMLSERDRIHALSEAAKAELDDAVSAAGVSRGLLARLSFEDVAEIYLALARRVVLPLRPEDLDLLETIMGASPARPEWVDRAGQVLEIIRAHVPAEAPENGDQGPTIVHPPPPTHRVPSR